MYQLQFFHQLQQQADRSPVKLLSAFISAARSIGFGYRWLVFSF